VITFASDRGIRSWNLVLKLNIFGSPKNKCIVFTTQLIIMTRYAPGRIESVLKGKTNHARGTRWWTNGTTTKMSEDCPGPEWTSGRTTSQVHSHS
jgi:hypothetical protein